MAGKDEEIGSEEFDLKLSKEEGKKLPQYIAAIVVNITSLVHGAGLGWLSPILPILQSEISPIGRPVSDEEGSWLGALVCLGAIFGTLLYVFISNRTSRKVTGYLVAVPYILAYILIIFAHSVSVLYVARLLAGVGTAATTVFCPLYVTEIAEDNLRGALGTLYVLGCYFGVLFIYIFGAFVPYNTTSCILLAIIGVYIIALYFIPETPLYLVSKGDLLGASRSLKWLRGTDSEFIDYEISKVVVNFKRREETGTSISLKQLLKSRGSRVAFIISLLLVMNLQLSAPIAILSYTGTIFKDAGSDLSPNASSIIVAILQIVGTFIATLLLDRAGRRILLILSNFFIAICLSGLGVYFYCKTHNMDVSGVTWIPLVCLSTYVVTIAIGVSPIPFLMIPELFLPEARNLAILISLTFMWFIAFLVTKFFTNISAVFGLPACYWIFGGFCFVGLLLSVFVFPETKNKSIDVIFEELNTKKKVHEVHNRRLQ